MDFYSLLTTVGQAQLANAVALNKQWSITQLALGDGGGAAVVPSESMTALVHEVYRCPLSQLYADVQNTNWIVAEANVPANVGGWTVREVGLYDASGNLVVVANIPDSYKPVLAEGSGKEMIFRVICEISNASSVVLQIDPTIVIASKTYVDNSMAAHTAAVEPHIRRPALRWFLRNQ